MSTKRIGIFLAIIGVILFLASLLLDFVIPGDTGLGASQLLGLQVGVVVLLIGLFLIFVYPEQRIQMASSLRTVVQRILGLPVDVWILVGFAIVYTVFFLFPVFFNPERTMWYFNRYVPNANPIGSDIRDIVNYVHQWLVLHQSPYGGDLFAYPPLDLVLFAPLLLMGYPAYFYLITILTLLFHVGSALVLSLFIRQHANVSLPLLVFGLSLFSYGLQFELERGQYNVITFAICLIAIYIFHARYEYRYVAYLLFTLSVQLKIYPAIMIVMFVKDWRDWKGNIRRFAGIALLNLALLFLLGFRTFGEFLNAVAGKQAYAGSWNGNHSLKGFVYHLSLDGFGLFSPETVSAFQQFRGGIELFLLIIIALCFLAVLIHAYLQNDPNPNSILLLVSTICALIIPSISNDYKLPIITAPMAAVFCSLALPEQRWKRSLAIFLILIMSMAYWSTQYPFSVKPYILTRNFTALFILLLAVTALNFVVSEKRSAAVAQPVED